MSNIKIQSKNFGTLYDGSEVQIFVISNDSMSVSCTDFGCHLTSIKLPSKNGQFVDVLLGCSTLEGYAQSDCDFGPVVGRFANRIGGAKFSLNGKTYNLDKNDNSKNFLHGGFDCYEKKLWLAKKIKNVNGEGIQFTRTSYDGEQKFPGNVDFTVNYTLNENNELTLEYIGIPDEATPINLTNHAYFNLKGYDGGSIEDQELQLDCSKFVEVDENLIPTGKLLDVKENSAFDFLNPKLIGKDISKTQMGYDHAYCIDKFADTNSVNKFAVLKDPFSGRTMTVSTNLPACQIYTGNFIEGIVGKNGFKHHKHDAICLETEFYPDAPNHSDFPCCIFTPENPYHAITVYKFDF